MQPRWTGKLQEAVRIAWSIGHKSREKVKTTWRLAISGKPAIAGRSARVEAHPPPTEIDGIKQAAIQAAD